MPKTELLNLITDYSKTSPKRVNAVFESGILSMENDESGLFDP